MNRIHVKGRLLCVILAAAACLIPAGCRPRTPTTQEGETPVTESSDDLRATRLRLIIHACVNGTHAYQIKLHKKSGKGDVDAFGDQGMTDAELDALVDAHRKLLAADPAEVAKWVATGESGFEGIKAMETLVNARMDIVFILPVNVVGNAFVMLKGNGWGLKANALASLLQLCLEVNRDGTVLQDMFRLYLPLGLVVAPSEFGIADDNRAFLEVATPLARKSCKAPFKTSRAAWQIALRKVENWTHKHRGFGPREYADELLARDDIKPLVEKIKALPPQRVLVLGHSYTMKLHWSTLAPMNEIAAAVFRKLNPSVEFGHMGHGGMSATQARDRFLKDALAWKPDRVLIVVSMQGDENLAAMEEMTRAFRKIGAEVCCFDQIYIGRETWINPDREKLRARARKSGITVIEVGERLSNHPDRHDFVALDGIHMRPSYHKFMAGELLKFLVASGE